MTSGKMFFTAAIALIAVAASAVAKVGFRDVITEDSFTMLNIIPSSPGREEVAAADAKEFAERTGNPEAEKAYPPSRIGTSDRRHIAPSCGRPDPLKLTLPPTAAIWYN